MLYGSYVFGVEFVDKLIQEFQPKYLDSKVIYGALRTTELCERIKRFFPEDLAQANITNILKKWLKLEIVRYPKGYFFKTNPDALSILWEAKRKLKKDYSELQLQSNGDAKIIEFTEENWHDIYGDRDGIHKPDVVELPKTKTKSASKAMPVSDTTEVSSTEVEVTPTIDTSVTEKMKYKISKDSK